MLHPVVLETMARDRQRTLALAAAAARSRPTPHRGQTPSPLRAWAGWWFAGRSARGRTEQPAVHDAYLASLR